MAQNLSFIERLTNEQIQSFLNQLYPNREGFEVSFKLIANLEPYYYIEIFHFGWEEPQFIRLKDYSSTLQNPSKWIQYLTSIFGHEYKKAFIERCTSIFDEN